MIRTTMGLVAGTLFLAGPALAGPALAGPAFAGPAVAGPAHAGPAVAGPALAGPPNPGYVGGGRGPGADLTLTYAAEAGFAAAVKLECDPPGGGHPKPVDACAELTAVGGEPDKIEPGRGACMMIYAPITAEITGDWQGTAVDWRHTYGNSCEMKRALGVLFAF